MLTTVSDDLSAFIRNDSWTFFHNIGLGQGLKTMAFSFRALPAGQPHVELNRCIGMPIYIYQLI